MSIPRLRFEPLIVLGLVSVLVIIFNPVVSRMALLPVDYGIHSQLIETLINGQAVREFVGRVPHFLYHGLVWLTVPITGDVVAASRIVALVGYGVYAVMVYVALRQLAGAPVTYQRGWFYASATAAICLAMPISWLVPGHLYHGSIALNVYHNPTIVVLKPLAIALLLLIIPRITTRQSQPGWPWIFTAGVVTLACILAKPSFVLPLLPALLLVGGYRLLRGQMLDVRSLLLGVVFPAGVLLGLQSLIFDTSGLVFAPLGYLRTVGVADAGLLPRFLFSILFPLYVLIAYRESFSQDAGLQLSWLTFSFGAAAFYLLGESGRMADGNWTWSAQISLLVLFVVSTARFIRSIQSVRDIRMWVGFGILALHVVSGIIWYQVHLLPDPYAYW